MRMLVAQPVLSADALSSVACGTQAMLAILVLAALAVGVSYRQTIRAYPRGGGSYMARENLGRVAGLRPPRACRSTTS